MLVVMVAMTNIVVSVTMILSVKLSRSKKRERSPIFWRVKVWRKVLVRWYATFRRRTILTKPL